MAYSWHSKLREGKNGCQVVIDTFRAHGLEVEDVQDDPDYRRTDIDLLVNGLEVEVKTEAWAVTNMFLELTCDTKPGALYKSQAELWAVYFQARDIILTVRLEELRAWVDTHRDNYDLKTVESRAGKRTWAATGIAVPVEHLTQDIAMKPFLALHIEEQAA